jgi:hypothetical protein
LVDLGAPGASDVAVALEAESRGREGATASREATPIEEGVERFGWAGGGGRGDYCYFVYLLCFVKMPIKPWVLYQLRPRFSGYFSEVQCLVGI